LSKPVALVTNACAFAGPPAIAALLEAGVRIAAHDVSFAEPAGRDTYRAAHPDVVVVDAQSPGAIVEAAWSVDRRLDVLVSNDAYRPIHGSIEGAAITDLQTTLDRLVVFPFEIAKAAIPRLKAQPASRVVVITSNRNRLPLAGGAIPDIARAGANALVRSLSLELAPHGIPVNAIAPNYLYSETYYPRARFVEDATGRDYIERVVPAGRLARPEEIGELIRYLATMRGTFLTGATIDFSGGWPVALPPPDWPDPVESDNDASA
jgi:NAD(P)-dependent dehydrogenase (short-subunit alcohol dehydrogenase family)